MQAGIIILIVIGALVLVFLIAMLVFNRGMGRIKRLKIDSIDLSKIPNGTYQGRFSGGRWSNKLEVQVEDNKIKDINILKDVTVAIEEVSSGLISKIKEEQNLEIDAVSGATVNTKAYLKSIENALKNAKERK
jgi:uncharacterized protein with FMN-binding domain